MDRTGDSARRYRRVAYYPGCGAGGATPDCDRATRALARKLGLRLQEVKDWSCCGAWHVRDVAPHVQAYLGARVLSQAVDRNRLGVVVSACALCHHNLRQAEHDLVHDPDARAAAAGIARSAGHTPYSPGAAETLHALDWLYRAVGPGEIKARSRGRLQGVKVACFYGCRYARPRQLFPEMDKGAGSETTTDPHRMDELLAAAGAAPVPFPSKTACCGGAHALTDPDTASRLVASVLEAADAAGADVIATACTPCNATLERLQDAGGDRTRRRVAILHFAQLLGLALGISSRKLGVRKAVVPGAR